MDGFTAELGASGLFCPRHITLPVTASFFSLSEHEGTSPYLVSGEYLHCSYIVMISCQFNIQGQIDLSGVGKRGYHIPKKGTVQVVSYDLSISCLHPSLFLSIQTLLNPNQTVVKIYFVKYDFSDMPPNSHTFLRHKTLSRPCHGSPAPAIPVLHYLIHLR